MTLSGDKLVIIEGFFAKMSGWQAVLWGVSAVLSGLFCVYGVVAYQVRVITYPQLQPTPDLAQTMPSLQAVDIPHPDGLTLAGWLSPAQNGKTLILQHGYAANSLDNVPLAEMLVAHGYGVLLFDFHGHGNSDAAQVTLGLTEVTDTQAAVAFLQGHPQTQTDQLGIVGVSMGGATAIMASAEIPELEIVVADSTFAALRNEIAVGIEVKTPLPGTPLDQVFITLAQWQTGISLSDIRPVDKIGDISPRPVLIIQGEQDARVLPYNGADLYAAAKEPKQLWQAPVGDHAQLFQADPAGYEAVLLQFLRENWQ